MLLRTLLDWLACPPDVVRGRLDTGVVRFGHMRRRVEVEDVDRARTIRRNVPPQKCHDAVEVARVRCVVLLAAHLSSTVTPPSMQT